MRSDDISTILMTARTCTLAPNKIAQSGLPAKMVGKVLKLAPEDRFASAIHAAALYRAGDWENAVSVASIEGKQPSLAIGDDLLAQTLPAFRSVIGAMAAYQGGSPAALGKLKLGAEISSIVEDSMENCPWPMQAELTILRSEVDSMIQAQPK